MTSKSAAKAKTDRPDRPERMKVKTDAFFMKIEPGMREYIQAGHDAALKQMQQSIPGASLGVGPYIIGLATKDAEQRLGITFEQFKAKRR